MKKFYYEMRLAVYRAERFWFKLSQKLFQMKDTYTIKYDESLEKYVMFINDVPMMKSKTASAVSNKLWKWLYSQNR